MGEAKAKVPLAPDPHSPAAERGREVWAAGFSLSLWQHRLSSDLERALQQFLSLKDKVFICTICNINTSKQ